MHNQTIEQTTKGPRKKCTNHRTNHATWLQHPKWKPMEIAPGRRNQELFICSDMQVIDEHTKD